MLSNIPPSPSRNFSGSRDFPLLFYHCLFVTASQKRAQNSGHYERWGCVIFFFFFFPRFFSIYLFNAMHLPPACKTGYSLSVQKSENFWRTSLIIIVIWPGTIYFFVSFWKRIRKTPELPPFLMQYSIKIQSFWMPLLKKYF